MNDKSKYVAAILLLISAISLPAQEKSTVSVEQITDTFNLTSEIGGEISEMRTTIKTDEDLQQFFQAVASAQRRIEPAILLIAQTDPPKEVQPYAISVAIAAKALELALWNYVNTFITDKQVYLDNADDLMRQSKEELDRAALIAPATANAHPAQ